MLQSFEILPCRYPIILIDRFDFPMYIHCHFFSNMDKFYVQRSERGSLGLSAL